MYHSLEGHRPHLSGVLQVMCVQNNRAQPSAAAFPGKAHYFYAPKCTFRREAIILTPAARVICMGISRSGPDAWSY